MKTTVTEIAPDTYRISTFSEPYGMQFNQFLIKDAEPFLMHTGMRAIFPAVKDAVRSVLDPATVRWIGWSHFEADECGSLNEWLAVAPRAQAVCNLVGALVNINDFTGRESRVLADDEILSLGRHRLRFLSTPHVPHAWDAGLFFDETEKTLLCSDLFFHAGDPEPLTETDIVGRAKAAMVANRTGPFANDMPYTPYTRATIERLAALDPKTLALMHGSSFHGNGRKAILELAGVIDEVLGA